MSRRSGRARSFSGRRNEALRGLDRRATTGLGRFRKIPLGTVFREQLLDHSAPRNVLELKVPAPLKFLLGVGMRLGGKRGEPIQGPRPEAQGSIMKTSASRPHGTISRTLQRLRVMGTAWRSPKTTSANRTHSGKRFIIAKNSAQHPAQGYRVFGGMSVIVIVEIHPRAFRPTSLDPLRPYRKLGL